VRISGIINETTFNIFWCLAWTTVYAVSTYFLGTWVGLSTVVGAAFVLGVVANHAN
jgi:ABC-type protease/lipase transport system fused ATPase/permease subunit